MYPRDKKLGSRDILLSFKHLNIGQKVKNINNWNVRHQNISQIGNEVNI
jgi:hypothetical protein